MSTRVSVKRILLCGFLCGCISFPAPVYCGEYDYLIPAASRGRNFWSDLLFQFGYDDNFETDEDVKNSSNTYSIFPKITFCYPAPSSIVLASYRLGYIFFEDADDNIDITHNLDLTLNHRFSAFLEARLSNRFRRLQEPEESITLVDEEGRILTDELGQPRTIVTRRSGDYDQNRTNLDVEYLFAERWAAEVEYEYFDYDHEDTVTGDEVDRTSQTAGIVGRYTLSFNPRHGQSYPNDISVGYRHINTDYKIAAKDSESDILYAQYSHWFDPRLRATVVGGYERRKFDESDTITDSVQDEPYINIALFSLLSRQFSASLSYGFRISETEEELFASRTSQLVSFGLNHKISPRSSIQLNGAMDFGRFGIDQALAAEEEDLIEELREDFDQNIFQLELNFRRRLSEQLTLVTGWRFTEVDSDIPDNSYTRNRYHLGISALF